MAKTVISVRLSDERLAQVDAFAARLKVNRSEAIDIALNYFSEVFSGKKELQYVPKQLFSHLAVGEEVAGSK